MRYLDSQIYKVVGVDERGNDFTRGTSGLLRSRQPFIDVLEMGSDHDSHCGVNSKGMKQTVGEQNMSWNNGPGSFKSEDITHDRVS